MQKILLIFRWGYILFIIYQSRKKARAFGGFFDVFESAFPD